MVQDSLSDVLQTVLMIAIRGWWRNDHSRRFMGRDAHRRHVLHLNAKPGLFPALIGRDLPAARGLRSAPSDPR